MSDEGAANGSAYSSQFRNLFGEDNHIDGDSGGKSKSGGSYSVGSVEPSSLFSQEPMPMFEERSRTQNNANDITPSILLEQLAYVDNFIPSLEQDFASLDSWILQDSGGDSNSVSREEKNANRERLNDGGLGSDRRLAAELSIFADESFIFPDEDKRVRGTDDNKENNKDTVNENNKDLYGDSYELANNGKNNSNQDENVEVGKRSAHFLTQRRNTFLTSQYDHSKSRFSSKSKKKDEKGQPQGSSCDQDNVNSGVVADDGIANSPLGDHGSFTNVDIISGGNGSAAGSANDEIGGMEFSHSPNFFSPLNNILACQVLQPYSVSTSPVASTRQSDSASTTSHTQLTTSDTSNKNCPQIHIPNYSTIPTSTLVALLPKVSIPSGAYRTLLDKGFHEEQIQAISAIIAHHEQEKLKERTGGNLSVRSSTDTINEQDTAKNAEFLVGILSRDSTPQEGEREGHVDSPLQSSKVRNESCDNDEFDDLIEVKEEERECEDDSIISLKSLKRGKTTGESPLVPSNIKRRNVSVADIISPSSTATMQFPKSHQKRRLKEKELVNSVTELSELAISLQQKIHTLEMENKLLKNLFKSSGELEDIGKAENIKKQIMYRIRSSNDSHDD